MFVAGGTAGIGLAVARALVNAGAEVVIGGRRVNGEEKTRSAGCRFAAVDASDELGVKRALAEAKELVGPLDVLVPNAGIAQPVATLEALASDDARRVVEVDLLGVIWGLKRGAAHLRDGASVILTSSIAPELATGVEPRAIGSVRGWRHELAHSAGLRPRERLGCSAAGEVTQGRRADVCAPVGGGQAAAGGGARGRHPGVASC